MAQTSYGDISQRTAGHAAEIMLEHAEPILVLSKFGLSKPMPKNKADNIKFRRPVPFAVSTTPLVEGATPTPQAMVYEDVSVTLQQHGAVTQITDKVDDLSEDPVLKDAAMLSGEQAAETVELVTWGAVKGGTNVFYDTVAHTSRATVDSKISLGRLRAITRALRSNRGKPVTSMTAPSVMYGTKPIEGGFIAFGHTDLDADLRGLAGFVPVAEYGSRQPLCPQECGSIENIRFILSPVLVPFLAGGAAVGATGMVAADATNVDVYPLIVVAKDAYGLVPLKGGGAITPKVLNPDTPSKSDPLGQVGFISWKTYFAAKILNENWLARLEVGVTDL
ncbi:MAG: N4-gp56 family major capsid protein [Methylococcaceae bacterium]|nr:N4-gp56 family major capsid protein [Methylococcaceae bacterium]